MLWARTLQPPSPSQEEEPATVPRFRIKCGVRPSVVSVLKPVLAAGLCGRHATKRLDWSPGLTDRSDKGHVLRLSNSPRAVLRHP
ncbi:hypothetical protein MTO96_048419 [Rhipicephalus appendiculatus]